MYNYVQHLEYKMVIQDSWNGAIILDKKTKSPDWYRIVCNVPTWEINWGLQTRETPAELFMIPLRNILLNLIGHNGKPTLMCKIVEKLLKIK